MTVLRNSAWTGRAPRTLEGAFGPHTSKNIVPMADPVHPRDRIVMVASAVAAFVLGALMLLEVVA